MKRYLNKSRVKKIYLGLEQNKKKRTRFLIIEMRAFITLESHYQNFFDLSILIYSLKINIHKIFKNRFILKLKRLHFNFYCSIMMYEKSQIKNYHRTYFRETNYRKYLFSKIYFSFIRIFRILLTFFVISQINTEICLKVYTYF